jgi:hypothetical protein
MSSSTRPSLFSLPSGSTSNSSTELFNSGEEQIFLGVKLFLIPQKIDFDEARELISVARKSGAVLCKIQDADVIVTRISAKARLERHIDWALAVR